MTRVARRAGVCLASVQFVVALSWVVLLIFLPRLAGHGQAGLPPASLFWVLMLVQSVGIGSDLAVGAAFDRIGCRWPGRPGALWIAGAAAVSGVAFGLLPLAATRASLAWAALLLVTWAATSSLLRVPPLLLIGRRAAGASQPALVGMSLLGLGLANALAPHLDTALPRFDPRLLFGLCGAALASAGVAIVAVERLLARDSPVAAGAAPPSVPVAAGLPGLLVLLLAAALAATAFQVHASINSAPLFQRHAAAADLRYLTPVLWVGFSLFLLPATSMIKRFGGVPVMAAAAGVAGVAALAAQAANGLQMLVNLQFFIGCAWACILAGAVATALALGAPDRQGRCIGALSAVLAFAALLRLALTAFASPPDASAATALAWLPGIAWLLAAAIWSALLQRRQAGPVSRS